jgi:hypothetical protein
MVSTTVTVTVNARVDLVGNIAAMGAIVGGSGGIVGIGGAIVVASRAIASTTGSRSS